MIYSNLKVEQHNLNHQDIEEYLEFCRILTGETSSQQEEKQLVINL